MKYNVQANWCYLKGNYHSFLCVSSPCNCNRLLCYSFSSLNFCLNDTQEGLSIPWPRIGLHAIQNNNGLRSIYFMINSEVAWPGVYENNVHNNGNVAEDPDDNDEGHESDTEEPITEFYVVPIINTAEQDIVEAIFNAMKHCQSLHPDPDDSISEEDFMEAEDDDGAEGVRNLHIDGKHGIDLRWVTGTKMD